jgi:hypothetical protein
MPVVRVAVLLFTLCFPAFRGIVNAQHRCGTVEYMKLLRQQKKIKQTDTQFEDWLLKRKLEQLRQFRTEQSHGGPYEIPVVVHVIHNGDAVGVDENISSAQINSQLNVINNDFKRLNADAVNTPAAFQPLAGSIDITFVLARSDPNGLPTTGIVRLNGGQSSWSMFAEEAEYKALSYWPSEDYLNIWVIKSASTLIGYAQFPVSDDIPGLEEFTDGIAATDGVVIDYMSFGSVDDGPFNLDPAYNKGRTLTHELGHFLGLRHLWGDDDNCATDYVSDTPPQDIDTSGCPSGVRTDACSPLAPGYMYQNFLDYTNDACMNLFTDGQVDRMELVLSDPAIPRRLSLLTSPGLLPPSCDDLDVALTAVVSPGVVTCNPFPQLNVQVLNLSCDPVTSLQIQFSVNGSSAVTTTFSGLNIASGATHTLQCGSLSLSSAENEISLTVTQVNGQPDDQPANNSLQTGILVDQSTDFVPLVQSFNDNSFGYWSNFNPSAGAFWNLNGTSGDYRARYSASSAASGDRSWLVSPVLDFSTLTEASVFFDLSYEWDGENSDTFEVYQSYDCGDTYSATSIALQGQQLQNASGRKFLDLTPLVGGSNVRVAFVATSAGGSEIDVDNIEFYQSNDKTPINTGSEPYAVYWQSPGEPAITFSLDQRMDVQLEIVDMMGRRYLATTLPQVLNQTYPINLTHATQGIYIVRVQLGTRYYATKVFIAP